MMFDRASLCLQFSKKDGSERARSHGMAARK